MDEKKNIFLKIDGIFMIVTKVFSWISPFILVIMSLIATVNVITAKLFVVSVPGNIYWITYLLVPVIFFAVSHEQLYRGLSYVDIFTNRFPQWVNTIVRFFSMVAGALIFALFGYSGISKLQSTYQYKTLSDTNSGGFYLWPFYLILVAMCFLLAATFVWSAVRVLYYKGEIPYPGAVMPEDEELEEELKEMEEGETE